MALSPSPTPAPDLTSLAIQGIPQLIAVIIGGAITLAATIITTGRQSKQALAAREAERQAERDDIQRQVLFELQEALHVFVRNIGRELRDKKATGNITDEADRELMEGRIRLRVRVDRLRARALREQAVKFERMCDQACLSFQQRDDILKTLRPLMTAYTTLRDAVGVEVQKYL